MMIFVKRILVKTTIHTFTSLNGANRWTQERWEESKPPEEKTSKKLLVSSYLSVYYMVVFFWWGAIEINYKIKIYDPDDTGHKEFAKMIIWPVVCFSWLAIDCMYIYLNGLWFSLVHSYSHIHTNLKWNVRSTSANIQRDCANAPNRCFYSMQIIGSSAHKTPNGLVHEFKWER